MSIVYCLYLRITYYYLSAILNFNGSLDFSLFLSPFPYLYELLPIYGEDLLTGCDGRLLIYYIETLHYTFVPLLITA